jgi:hypothetical protein
LKIGDFGGIPRLPKGTNKRKPPTPSRTINGATAIAVNGGDTASTVNGGLPAPSESSPALPMEEPPLILSMESPLVDGLEESQHFFSEYEDIEEDSQLEVNESGDSDISSDDDEYCDIQILYHGS